MFYSRGLPPTLNFAEDLVFIKNLQDTIPKEHWITEIDRLTVDMSLIDIHTQRPELFKFFADRNGYMPVTAEPLGDYQGAELTQLDDFGIAFTQDINLTILFGSSWEGGLMRKCWNDLQLNGYRSQFHGRVLFPENEDRKRISFSSACWTPKKNQAFWAGAIAKGRNFELVTDIKFYNKPRIKPTKMEIGWLLDNGYRPTFNRNGLITFVSPGPQNPQDIFLRGYKTRPELDRLNYQIRTLAEETNPVAKRTRCHS